MRNSRLAFASRLLRVLVQNIIGLSHDKIACRAKRLCRSRLSSGHLQELSGAIATFPSKENRDIAQHCVNPAWLKNEKEKLLPLRVGLRRETDNAACVTDTESRSKERTSVLTLAWMPKCRKVCVLKELVSRKAWGALLVNELPPTF